AAQRGRWADMVQSACTSVGSDGCPQLLDRRSNLVPSLDDSAQCLIGVASRRWAQKLLHRGSVIFWDLAQAIGKRGLFLRAQINIDVRKCSVIFAPGTCCVGGVEVVIGTPAVVRRGAALQALPHSNVHSAL